MPSARVHRERHLRDENRAMRLCNDVAAARLMGETASCAIITGMRSMIP
jgi:hypothetical protein